MEKALLQGFIAEGLSLEQIGKRVGKHPSTVGYWLKRHGLTAVHAERFARKGGLDRGTLEELVNEGLSAAEIGRQLGVSVTTVRYWLKRYGLRTSRMSLSALAPDDRPKFIERSCSQHGRTRFVRSGSGHYRCVKCRSEQVIKRRRKMKEILVAEGGGCCALCGYSRCVRALQFHHIDAGSKEFGLAHGGVTRALDRQRVEAQKCVLLCANCHAEVEDGMASLP